MHQEHGSFEIRGAIWYRRKARPYVPRDLISRLIHFKYGMAKAFAAYIICISPFSFVLNFIIHWIKFLNMKLEFQEAFNIYEKQSRRWIADYTRLDPWSVSGSILKIVLELSLWSSLAFDSWNSVTREKIIFLYEFWQSTLSLFLIPFQEVSPISL